MESKFVHLHLHTQYSLLDGVNKIPDVLEHAKSLGQSAIAMTDHGNMHGAVEFYLAAKKIGIKPILGCEIYISAGSRHDKRSKAQGGAHTHHLTVLAKDLIGYRNLCKVVSRAYQEGFYFKPRADKELLAEHSEGLIVLSGCLNSELNAFASRDNLEQAKELLEFYSKQFPGRFFLEVQPHPIPEQRKLNRACYELGRKMGIPVVATTDCHYPGADYHYAQEVLMCVATGKQITDPDRLRHEGVALHLKTAAEMLEEFGDESLAEEAVRTSVEIADQCNLEFSFNTYYMPQFVPERDTRTLIEIMAEKAREGLKLRIEQIRSRSPGFGDAEVLAYNERLEFEIQLIEKMGFAGYFLVVSDFIVWAKEHGVPVGPGRGSVAGSLVAYALRITEVDPIVNKLLFERFLNPERVSLPDIDVDFCMNGRDRVIDYVVNKYGRDRVAQIATFGTLKAKAAIKDVGRALGVSYAETDRVAQLIPAPRQGFDYPLSEALKMEPRLAEYAQREGKDLVSLALKLEGLTRHASTHAAGVVIGDRPLTELLPMMVDKDGHDVTQYDMSSVEKIGLVKFDFLGLKTLTVLHTALELIKESRGVEVDLNALPLEDPKTYAMICAGNTVGVFQLESSGITDMTMRLKPNCFDDLVAILALYRPGPLDAGMVDHYVNRKHGREPVTYSYPSMKSVLADTYGIMLYQEQIMQLARELAGYSLGEADLLRKAMGKKNPEEMAKQRSRFVGGAKERRVPEKLANEIFDQMETFARYGFNRSHSAAYALVSFQTAYLKAHYPVEFMAALLTHETDDSDKVLKNLGECRKQRLKVLPPDINQSVHNFSVGEGKIRFGLGAVKGIGEKAVQDIIAARAEGPFTNIDSFMSRVDPRTVNRRVVESLIKCGAFDSFGETRRGMFERLDDLMKYAQALHREEDAAQVSLFGDATKFVTPPRRAAAIPEWPVNQKLANEREALGFYISGHPLEKFRSDLKRLGAVSTLDARKSKNKQEVRVGGVVTALRLRNTKKGDRYASLVLEDDVATIETIVWPDTYQQVQGLLGGDNPVVITGRADVSDERAVLIANKVESLTEVRDSRATHGVLTLRGSDDFEARMQPLIQLLGKHTGNCPVKVRIEMQTADVSLVLRDQQNVPVKVMPSESLCDEVEQLFGRPVLTFL